jgi:hypothetical protein
MCTCERFKSAMHRRYDCASSPSDAGATVCPVRTTPQLTGGGLSRRARVMPRVGTACGVVDGDACSVMVVSARSAGVRVLSGAAVWSGPGGLRTL